MIKITIKRGGATRVEPYGFQGQTCKLASKPYLDALGREQSTIDTPEALQTEEAPAVLPEQQAQRN